MKLELRFKILCGHCHIEMEEEERGGVYKVRCRNPDCDKPSQVFIEEGS